LCVAGPRDFEFGPEAGTHQRVERFVCDVDPMCLLHPLAEGLLRGKTFRALQGLPQAGEDVGREGRPFAGGPIQAQQSRHTASHGAGQPAANGVPVDAQQLGHLLTGLGLATGQEIEPL
jgi:hypothetical protein